MLLLLSNLKVKMSFFYRMFYKSEIKGLKKLVNTSVDLKELFTKPEIEAFMDNKSNIKEDLHVPKHKRKLTILRLKKLFSPDFNLHDCTYQILSLLKDSVELRIGVSLLVHHGPEAKLIRYYYSIYHRALNKDLTEIVNDKDKEDLLGFLKPMAHSDILGHAFSQINGENTFEKSDFRPRKLVLATFWISRFE